MREVRAWWAAALGRSIRRGLVVFMYASFLAFLVGLYVANGTFTPPLAGITLAAGVVALVAWVRLLWAPGFVGDLTDHHLDERQRAIRDRAYRNSYLITVTLVLVGALIAMYWSGSDDQWSQLRIPGRFLPWFAFILGTLPTAVIAWTAPDEPEE